VIMPSSQLDSQPDPRPISTQASEDVPAELSAVVDELLHSLSTKFQAVSREMFAKMDEMSKRIDNLEATLQSNSESNSKGSPIKLNAP